MQRNLRKDEVKGLTGLSMPTIYRLMKQGLFPQNFKIGLRAVAWREGDIKEWMESRG